MISYADGLAALDWLTKAFGFQERRDARQTWPDGTLSHAEMDARDNRGFARLVPLEEEYQ